jgi:hypothetical protein
MALPRSALFANAAANVPLGTHALADRSALDSVTDSHDAPDKFVPRGNPYADATFTPRIPFIDMAIGPADSGVRNRDQDLTRTIFRQGYFRAPIQAWCVVQFPDGRH